MCYIFRRAGKRPFGLSPFGSLGMECPGLSYATCNLIGRGYLPATHIAGTVEGFHPEPLGNATALAGMWAGSFWVMTR